MNKDVDDIGLAILLPRKKIRFCPHNDRRIWHLRRQLSTNAEQIYSYRALHNTCPRSLSNNSNPTPVVSATTTTMNSKTLSSHRITLSIQYTHHVWRRKIIAQPAWILLHRKHPTVYSTSTSYGMNFTIQQQIQQPNAFRTTRLKTAFDKTNITTSRTTRLSKI